MTMKSRPSSLPKSMTSTMFLCRTSLAVRASWRKRAGIAGFECAISGSSSFTATVRWIVRCRASNTAPVPPTPSTRTSS